MNSPRTVSIKPINEQGQQLLYNAIHFLQELFTNDVVLVGAIGLMVQLGEQHRKTFDLDIVTSNPQASIQILKKHGALLTRESPARLIIPEKITIDVLSMHDEQESSPHTEFATMAKAYAFKDSSFYELNLPSVCDDKHLVKVASAASLVALKMYEMSERRGANADEAGADAYDITLIISDPNQRKYIARQISSYSADLADHICKAIKDCFIKSSVLTAAAMRLTQKAKHQVEASQVAVIGESFLSELQQDLNN